MALEEDDRPVQKSDCGRRLLVAQDLGVGEPGAVVDRDVDVLPADRLVDLACTVREFEVVVLAQAVADAFAGATLDAAELLDINVDELAGSLALVALCRLECEPAEPAQPDPGQDAGDGRERHLEEFGQVRAGEAQPPERGDRLDAVLGRAIGEVDRRRRAVEQPELAILAVAGDPLTRAADADFGGRGRLRQRPVLLDDPSAEQAAFVQAEGSVSVKVHSVSSLGLGRLAAPSLQGGPDEPTCSLTTSRARSRPPRRSRGGTGAPCRRWCPPL